MKTNMKPNVGTITMLGLVVPSLALSLLASLPCAAEAGPVKKMGSPSSQLTADVSQMGIETPVTVVARGKSLQAHEKNELRAALKRGEILVVENTDATSMAEVTGYAPEAQVWVVRSHARLPIQVFEVVVPSSQTVSSKPPVMPEAKASESTGNTGGNPTKPVPPGVNPREMFPGHEAEDQAAAKPQAKRPLPPGMSGGPKEKLARALGHKNRQQDQADLEKRFHQNSSLRKNQIQTRGLSTSDTPYAIKYIRLYDPYVQGTQNPRVDYEYVVEMAATDKPNKAKWLVMRSQGLGVSPTTLSEGLESDTGYERKWFQDRAYIVNGFLTPTWQWATSYPTGWNMVHKEPLNQNNVTTLSVSSSTSFGLTGTSTMDGPEVGFSMDQTKSNTASFNLSDWKVAYLGAGYQNIWDFQMSAAGGAAYDVNNPAGTLKVDHCYVREPPILSKAPMTPFTATSYRGPYNNDYVRYVFGQWHHLERVKRDYCSHNWLGQWSCQASQEGAWRWTANYGVFYMGEVYTATGK
ncbi:MAG: hypothetical protein OEY91_05730 [Nitrospirota bacterium]|nr:hypothetical protein [Nitrospirota bacterium]